VRAAVLRPPRVDERLLLLGSTGSGKTEAARALLASGNYHHWVAIDWKGDFDPPVDCVLTREPPWEHSRAWQQERVLYRPRAAGDREPRALDRVLRWIFDRQQDEFDWRRRRPRTPRVLYLDEAFHVARRGQTAALSDLATAGRALGLGLWVGSQRPRWIPVEVRSEASRWLVFYLTYREDQLEVTRYTAGQLTVDQLQRGWRNHSFWELSRAVGRDGFLRVHVRHFPPIRIPPHQQEV